LLAGPALAGKTAGSFLANFAIADRPREMCAVEMLKYCRVIPFN